ncbi:c-type cytochrome [Halobacteriovorax sp. ZH4_bin.1]|uniref:c-type cytochrome n=1 Tax=unclassified Halobacteriovorax TaxID=2639665 RepID=UPI0037191877
MKKMALTLTAMFTILSLVSCQENHFKEDKVFAGGLYVEKDVLNRGKQIYTEYCMPCHGVNGDGKGVAAKAMKVPPRDFTKGVFKFGEVEAGTLPHDKHLYKILEKGLHGTAMLPWDLTEDQMFEVVQYIKTFAPSVWEGKDKELGKQVTLGKNPYGVAHVQSAIEEGKKVYHSDAMCWSCHRAYVPKMELAQLTGMSEGDFSDADYQSKLQETEWGFKSLPPDFTWNTIRSADTVEEIALRLAAGVGGTAMAAWKGTLTDDQIWAVAHYVDYLKSLKDTEARKELMDRIKNQ